MRKRVLITVALIFVSVVLGICAGFYLIKRPKTEKKREVEQATESTPISPGKLRLDELKKRIEEKNDIPLVVNPPARFTDDLDKDKKVDIIQEHLWGVMNAMAELVLAEIGINPHLTDLKDKDLSCTFYKESYKKIQLLPDAVNVIMSFYKNYDGVHMEIYGPEVVRVSKEILRMLTKKELANLRIYLTLATFEQDRMIAAAENPEDKLELYKKAHDAFWEQGIGFVVLPGIVALPNDTKKSSSHALSEFKNAQVERHIKE